MPPKFEIISDHFTNGNKRANEQAVQISDNMQTMKKRKLGDRHDRHTVKQILVENLSTHTLTENQTQPDEIFVNRASDTRSCSEVFGVKTKLITSYFTNHRENKNLNLITDANEQSFSGAILENKSQPNNWGIIGGQVEAEVSSEGQAINTSKHQISTSFMCRTINKVTKVSHNPEEEPVSGPEQAEVPGQQPDPGQQQSLKVLGSHQQKI